MEPFLYFSAASYYTSLYINEKCYSLKLDTFITVSLSYIPFICVRVKAFIIVLKLTHKRIKSCNRIRNFCRRLVWPSFSLSFSGLIAET